MKNPNFLFSLPMWWLVVSNVGIMIHMFVNKATGPALIVLFRTLNVVTFFTKVRGACAGPGTWGLGPGTLGLGPGTWGMR